MLLAEIKRYGFDEDKLETFIEDVNTKSRRYPSLCAKHTLKDMSQSNFKNDLSVNCSTSTFQTCRDIMNMSMSTANHFTLDNNLISQSNSGKHDELLFSNPLQIDNQLAPNITNLCKIINKNPSPCYNSINVQRNNSNKSDLPVPMSESDIYRECQYSGRVIRVEGDGRCLFRSLVTCKCPQLQKAIRDEFGCPVRHDDATLETQLADTLRLQVVRLMEDNAPFYSQLGKAVINADQPNNQPHEYHKFGDRLHAMTIPSTMPGDLELNATSAVLEVRILVLDVNLRYVFLYGKDRFPEGMIYAIRYTRLGPDVGHFDAVILDIPVEDLIDLFQTQKIDHMGSTDLEPSIKDMASLSIRDQSHKHSGSQDKSCQTMSAKSLMTVNQIGNTNDKFIGKKKLHCHQRGVSVPGKETTDNQNEETSMFPIICDYCDDLLSPTIHGEQRKKSKPHGAESKIDVHGNKVENDPRSGRKQFDDKRESRAESDVSSQQRISSTNQQKNKIDDKPKFIEQPFGVHKYFGEPKISASTTCIAKNRVPKNTVMGIGDQVLSMDRILAKSACRSMSGKGINKLGNRRISARRLQDSNENHKAMKSKKRKASGGRMQTQKAPVIKKGRIDNQILRNHNSQTPRGRTAGKPVHKNGSSIITIPAFNPLTSLPVRIQELCFICLEPLPVSRQIRVQCYLCCKVAHRPCVRKYLNWGFNDKIEEDEYFLCQQCVPL